MLSTKDLARIALFAALIAALGLIPKFDLPFTAGVPITAQTLGVMLAGLILGPRNGLLAVLLFLFVVALGAPVLSGGRGGLGVFFGPTLGFLAGWVLGAWMCGAVFFWLVRHWPGRIFFSALLAAILGGILAVYALGIPTLAWIANMPVDKAALVSLVFVPGDLIKAFVAAWITQRLRRVGLRSA
ncbi:MAG: biotin transporter BioY [Burkholderiaceae bacterium]|nr:biotin transporter BioY [Burkholderiaceae bacterium]